MPVATDTVVQYLIQRRSRLLGYAWVIVGDEHAAEDIFQDVSMAAVRKCDQIDDGEHLDRWVRHAIRLKGLEVRRNRKDKAQLLSPEVLDIIEQTWTHTAYANESERMDALRRCIAQLQGTAREVVTLRYGEGMKSQAIADKLGRRVETVYKATTRAHAGLKECIERRLKAEGGHHE